MGTWAFIDSLRSCEGTYHLNKSNSCCVLEKVGVNAIAITLDLGIQNLLILKKVRCKSVLLHFLVRSVLLHFLVFEICSLNFKIGKKEKLHLLVSDSVLGSKSPIDGSNGNHAVRV